MANFIRRTGKMTLFSYYLNFARDVDLLLAAAMIGPTCVIIVFADSTILTTLPKDSRSPCVGAAPDSGAAVVVHWWGSDFFQMADGQCETIFLLRFALSLKTRRCGR